MPSRLFTVVVGSLVAGLLAPPRGRIAHHFNKGQNVDRGHSPRQLNLNFALSNLLELCKLRALRAVMAIFTFRADDIKLIGDKYRNLALGNDAIPR